MWEVLVRRLAFLVFLLAVIVGLVGTSWAGSPNGGAPSPTPTPDPTPAASIGNPAVVESLLNLMVSKGVLTTEEAVQLRGMPAGQQVTPLLSILAKKGVLSPDEVAALTSPTPMPLVVSSSAQAPVTTQAAAPKPPDKPPVIAAIAPLRVLPIDAPKKDGLIPD